MFLVDEGAWMMVASTIMPVVIRMPLLSRYTFTVSISSRNCSRRVFFE